MQAVSKKKRQELQQIISRMPLTMISATVQSEFSVRWREVSRAVRNFRLPMVPASVARVLTQHAKSLPDEEVSEILARLRLKLEVSRERKWNVIDLKRPKDEGVPVEVLINELPSRVADALRNTRGGKSMWPEVQTTLMQDLLFMSVQMVSDTKQGPILYVATPPGQPVALVSSLTSSGLLKGCVEGLGYKEFEDACLSGPDIHSLLRIHNQRHNDNALHLVSLPEYNPVPVVTSTGIDYTYKTYNERYVDQILGPNPPVLTELTISSVKPFFDPSRLNRTMRLTIQLKSDDIAKTLKNWVSIGAISPTSDFFQIFHDVKSNKICIQDDDDDKDNS